MRTIQVNASKKYQILISQTLNGLGEFLKPLIKGDKVAIITDSNVNKLYSSAVKSAIEDKTVYVLEVESGEDSKCASVYINLVNQLASFGFKRNSTVIALGGGVVGDLAGFVSATYMRGINFIQIPTTLLAMVDSSVGGKTAINLEAGKNLLGAFYQPSGVYVCLDFLKTLPSREITSGLGEIVKYAFIDDRITPSLVEERNYLELVQKSLEIKRDIVERDERESGERMLLNFGHTVGHAIEKLSGYTLSHGECVIKGSYSALKVSKNLNLISDKRYEEGVNLLKTTGVNPCDSFTSEEIISIIKSDKKGSSDSVNFIASNGLGKPQIIKLKYSELINLL